VGDLVGAKVGRRVGTGRGMLVGRGVGRKEGRRDTVGWMVGVLAKEVEFVHTVSLVGASPDTEMPTLSSMRHEICTSVELIAIR